MNDFFRGGDMHGGRESVIRRLGHVHMIIRVHGILASALTPRAFNRAIGNDLVGIHVGLGARTGLPNAQGEMSVQFSGDDFIRGGGDQASLVFRQLPEVLIDERAGFFEQAETTDERTRHGIAANGKKLQGPLRLGSPIGVMRDLNGSHGIGFGAAGSCAHRRVG